MQENVERFSESGLRVLKIQHTGSNQLIFTFSRAKQETIGTYELLVYWHTKAKVLTATMYGLRFFLWRIPRVYLFIPHFHRKIKFGKFVSRGTKHRKTLR